MSRQRTQRETRRRSGCYQCKDKHVRCTEETPICYRCKRLNLKCERGLKPMYQEDAVQRGISFGREGKGRRAAAQHSAMPATGREAGLYTLPIDQYAGRWVFLNTTYEDFGVDHHHSETNVTEKPDIESLLYMASDDDNLDSVTSTFGHPLAQYSEIESYLLDYFIHGIGPNCSLTQTDNPYISLITPLSFVHSTLRHALLAAAGNQLRLLGDKRFVKETLMYKSRAIKSLYQDISHNDINDGVIATVLMLCFYDISDECDPSWVTHMQAGLELLNHSTRNRCESPSLFNFFTMYFVAHDIMSRTASQKRAQVKRTYNWTEIDDLDEIDMVMGCSRRLMTLINDISDLAAKQTQNANHLHQTPEDPYFNMRTFAIRAALYDLKQTLPAHSAQRHDLTRIAEIKRLTALLYLTERLDIMACMSLAAKDRTSDTKQPSSPSKRYLVSTIICEISSLPDSATLLWPLFVLGNSGLENEDHRRFVLDRLGRMQKTRNLGSVRRARMAVKRAFQMVDLDCGGKRRWADTIGVISLA